MIDRAGDALGGRDIGIAQARRSSCCAAMSKNFAFDQCAEAMVRHVGTPRVTMNPIDPRRQNCRWRAGLERRRKPAGPRP